MYVKRFFRFNQSFYSGTNLNKILISQYGKFLSAGEGFAKQRWLHYNSSKC
jgi:hypothetical protein